MILKVFMDLLKNTYVNKLKAVDSWVVPQWVEEKQGLETAQLQH